MPRCAVFSIVDYNNYGNRLVCAATCKIFASLGVDAEIVFVENEDENPPFCTRLRKDIKNAFDLMRAKAFLVFVERFAKYFVKAVKKRVIKARRQRFITFSAEHVVEKDYGLSKYHFPPSFPAHFDFFVLGGDQVWNPFLLCTNVPGTVYFLPFAGNGKRAFMFSTSFGVSKDAFFGQTAKIPGLTDAYREALSRMNPISCREDSGVEITNALVGRGQVLIDPVMTLTREEWLAMAKKTDFLTSRVNGKNGYAVLFFLGKLPRVLKKRIKKICGDKNLAPISLNDLFDESAYVADPAEFLYLLANADAVYTDSFHGAALSILFEFPFFVFERLGYNIDMGTRFDTLLRKFGLEDRLIKDMRKFCPEDREFCIDFLNAREILSREREKTIRFLKTALDESKISAAKIE